MSRTFVSLTFLATLAMSNYALAQQTVVEEKPLKDAAANAKTSVGAQLTLRPDDPNAAAELKVKIKALEDLQEQLELRPVFPALDDRAAEAVRSQSRGLRESAPRDSSAAPPAPPPQEPSSPRDVPQIDESSTTAEFELQSELVCKLVPVRECVQVPICNRRGHVIGYQWQERTVCRWKWVQEQKWKKKTKSLDNTARRFFVREVAAIIAELGNATPERQVTLLKRAYAIAVMAERLSTTRQED